MKKLLPILAAILIQGCATNHQPYYAVGVGYKLDETTYYWWDNAMKGNREGNCPLSARLEVGMDAGNFRYGLSHHSQWTTGAPFNNEGEYQKTEVFIDYVKKFNLK